MFATTPESGFQNGPSTRRRIGIAIMLVFAVTAFGTIGFKMVGKPETWFESFYLTVITISTVGYGEIHGFTTSERVVAVFLILGGVSSISLLLTLVAGVVLEDVIGIRREQRRMEKKIESLHDHFVICGYGAMGSTIAEFFDKDNISFVVIEKDPEAAEEATRHGRLVVRGDATSDEVLEEARVPQARCLVAALESDAENLYLALSARQMRSDIRVVARSEEEGAAKKLKRAGADRVIASTQTGAYRMANAALRPAFVDFMEAMIGGPNELGIRFEELTVGEHSPAAGKNLISLNLGREYGVIVVAIMRRDGKPVFNPSAQAELHPGDTLIAIGDETQFKKVRNVLHADDRNKN